MTAPSTRTKRENDRLRLLLGHAAAIEEKGAAAATVADIVRQSGMSKRTFYEHFPDRTAALFELQREMVDQLMTALAEATGDVGEPFAERVATIIGVYLSMLAQAPALARAFLIEIPRLGDEGLAVRRAAHRRWGSLLKTSFADVELADHQVTALIGAVDELILESLESDDSDLMALESKVLDVITVLHAGVQARSGLASQPTKR